MSPAALEERVRDYVEAQRAHVRVPPVTASLILHAVQVSRPAPRRPRLAFVRVTAAIAAVLLVGVGVAWMRASQMPGIAAGTWSSASPMAVARGYQTATLLLNDKVLVVGGRGLSTVSAPWQPGVAAVASAELYDPKTRRWSSAGSLSAPRFGHTATLLTNGKVLVVGGNPTLPSAEFPIGADSLSSAELYDPQTNSWSLAASMHTPRAYQTATLLADGRVLVAGGIESSAADAGIVLAQAELYDPATNTWTEAAPMQSARANQSATLLADHRVLLIGGMNHFFNYPNGSPATGLTTTELFDPANDSWSAAPSMRYARISPSATLLPNGRVLVVGDEGVNEQTAEIFDPALGRWSASPKPSAGRAGHVAVLLHSGAVLIVGGLGEASAELFDWHRTTWASAASLAVMRSGATATVLHDGQVLVAGGFASGPMPLPSVELYDPHGTSAVAARVASSAPAPIPAVSLVLGIPTFLFGLVLLLMRRRLVRQSNAGEIWID